MWLCADLLINGQVYNLSAVDLCELAANSVKQSGFDEKFKKHCVGNYYIKGPKGNHIYQSNVPDARLDFRQSLLREEMSFIKFAGYPQKMMRAKSIGQLSHDFPHGALSEFKSTTSVLPDIDEIKEPVKSLSVPTTSATPVTSSESITMDNNNNNNDKW